MSTDRKQELHIIGGGVCGLYGGIQSQLTGIKAHLYEAATQFGGLAAGHQFGGNWYDLGVHMLHAFDESVFQTCKEAMGEERIEVPLKAHIKWLGKRYHYPLRGRDILTGLPPLQLIKCVTGLFLAEIKKNSEGEDAETALIELYGKPLYKFFFEDFTHRYWGMHPRELSAEFVRRKMPRLSAVDVFKNLLGWLKIANPKDAKEGALRFETLHYSKSGSEALPRLLAKKLDSLGGNLQSSSPIEAVHHDGSQITAIRVKGRLHGNPSDAFMSTIPLPSLLPCFTPAPPKEVLEAAANLTYKPMVVYALLVKKDQCMDALYTYYRDRVFHRVGEPKNAGLSVTPSGHTTLIVELTCEEGDEKWRGNAMKQIIKDLETEGLCNASDIIEHNLIHSKHAYPIFHKGFDTHLSVVMNYLGQFDNFASTGRQGAFSYPNMHSAMRMGEETALKLIKS